MEWRRQRLHAGARHRHHLGRAVDRSGGQQFELARARRDHLEQPPTETNVAVGGGNDQRTRIEAIRVLRAPAPVRACQRGDVTARRVEVDGRGGSPQGEAAQPAVVQDGRYNPVDHGVQGVRHPVDIDRHHHARVAGAAEHEVAAGDDADGAVTRGERRPRCADRELECIGIERAWVDRRERRSSLILCQGSDRSGSNRDIPAQVGDRPEIVGAHAPRGQRLHGIENAPDAERQVAAAGLQHRAIRQHPSGGGHRKIEAGRGVCVAAVGCTRVTAGDHRQVAATEGADTLETYERI